MGRHHIHISGTTTKADRSVVGDTGACCSSVHNDNYGAGFEGVETVAKDGIDHRKAVVVAVSFWVGMGFQNQAIFAGLLTGTWNALLSNSVTSGGLAAALMIGFIELTAARRKHLEVDLDFTSMPEVDRFLQRFAIDRGWNDASIQRLRGG